jgi:hypothetical protein
MLGVFSAKGGTVSDFDRIKQRHTQDGWKDGLFIALAVLLTALSIGAVTAKATGSPTKHQWSVTVVENPELAK